MEDNNQPSVSSEFISENLNQENNRSNNLLLNEIGSMDISSQNTIEKNKPEIFEIKEEKAENIIQHLDNNFNKEIKENKDYPLITKLSNIHKLVQKELSTRKLCK